MSLAVMRPMALLLGLATVTGARGEELRASPSDDPTSDVTIELESPNLPGRRPLPAGDIQASLHDEQLARWNLGGSGDASYPSNRPRFHPAVRVVVDTEVAGAWDRRGSAAALRRLVEARSRSAGYWPFRLCFEEALRSSPRASVDYRLRLTVTGAGHVAGVRGLVDLEDEPLGSCLEQAASALDLKTLPARRVDVDLRIRMWPGDAPVPSRQSPEADSPDPPGLSSVLRQASELWRASRVSVVRCSLAGLERDPALWGRIALKAEFGLDGSTTVLSEFESRFPDSEVTDCVTRVVRAFRVPGLAGLPLVFALRVGELPKVAEPTK